MTLRFFLKLTLNSSCVPAVIGCKTESNCLILISLGIDTTSGICTRYDHKFKSTTPTAIVLIVPAVGKGDYNFVIVYGVPPIDETFDPAILIKLVRKLLSTVYRNVNGVFGGIISSL